jgi:carboxypeptidase C (cathepsin A)
MKWFAAAAFFAAALGGAAAESDAQTPAPAAAATPAGTPAAPATAPPDAVTQQQISLGGKTYPYTARAGTIVLQDDKGAPACRMFYTAYTLDGADPAARPVTFFYNGGPGSSTVWLRMGSFGPVRVVVGNAAPTDNAPYSLVPNQYSLLDKSDLVFVDAPGTGFGRILSESKPDQFFGVDPDKRAFAQFVSRYITAFGRWNSPKFLFGESYGTPRSALLANELQDQGIGVNGVILLSSILDFGLDWDTNFTPTAIGGGDWAYPLYLPTEAAAAWYHDQLPGGRHGLTLPDFLSRVERFAMTDYLNALAQGSKLSPRAFEAIVAQIHAYTGISEKYIRESNIRVPYWRYMTELKRNQGISIGRYDARYTSFTLDPISDRTDFDATDAAIDSAYVGSANAYMRQTLGYHTDLEYKTEIDVFKHWDWKHNGAVPANTAQDLARAMVYNPKLRVFAASGYYDLATPFFATVYTLNHLNVPPEIQKNVSYGFYESGHMVYLNPDALAQFHDDLERWYDQALAPH